MEYISYQKLNSAHEHQKKLDYGFDSIYFRFEKMAWKCAELEAFSPEAKLNGHYGDIEYYKKHYNRECMRVWEILDELLGELPEHHEKERG